MANRFLGECTVEADNQSYTLRLDFNAMCEFEDLTGRNALEVFSEIESNRQQISIKTTRFLIWAALKHHHPDVSLATAGDVLSQNLECLADLMQAAMPVEEESAVQGKKPPAQLG